MIGLVVIVICIFISVLFYSKITNSCRNKGRGYVRTFLTALISSGLLFILTMSIGVASFFPPNEDGKISENTVQVKNTTHNRFNEKIRTFRSAINLMPLPKPAKIQSIILVSILIQPLVSHIPSPIAY